MTAQQKGVSASGAVLGFLALIYVPWLDSLSNVYYAPVWYPPFGGAEIATGILIVELAGITLLSGLLVFAFGRDAQN